MSAENSLKPEMIVLEGLAHYAAFNLREKLLQGLIPLIPLVPAGSPLEERILFFTFFRNTTILNYENEDSFLTLIEEFDILFNKYNNAVREAINVEEWVELRYKILFQYGIATLRNMLQLEGDIIPNEVVFPSLTPKISNYKKIINHQFKFNRMNIEEDQSTNLIEGKVNKTYLTNLLDIVTDPGIHGQKAIQTFRLNLLDDLKNELISFVRLIETKVLFIPQLPSASAFMSKSNTPIKATQTSSPSSTPIHLSSQPTRDSIKKLAEPDWTSFQRDLSGPYSSHSRTTTSTSSAARLSTTFQAAAAATQTQTQTSTQQSAVEDSDGEATASQSQSQSPLSSVSKNITQKRNIPLEKRLQRLKTQLESFDSPSDLLLEAAQPPKSLAGTRAKPPKDAPTTKNTSASNDTTNSAAGKQANERGSRGRSTRGNSQVSNPFQGALTSPVKANVKIVPPKNSNSHPEVAKEAPTETSSTTPVKPKGKASTESTEETQKTPAKSPGGAPPPTGQSLVSKERSKVLLPPSPAAAAAAAVHLPESCTEDADFKDEIMDDEPRHHQQKAVSSGAHSPIAFKETNFTHQAANRGSFVTSSSTGGGGGGTRAAVVDAERSRPTKSPTAVNQPVRDLKRRLRLTETRPSARKVEFEDSEDIDEKDDDDSADSGWIPGISVKRARQTPSPILRRQLPSTIRGHNSTMSPRALSSASNGAGGGRVKWSYNEEQALIEGVREHGYGHWRAILDDIRYGAHLRNRDNIALKDKWRNLLRSGKVDGV